MTMAWGSKSNSGVESSSEVISGDLNLWWCLMCICKHVYIYCIYCYISRYTYIYIYRERERDWYIYIDLYYLSSYIYRERETCLYIFPHNYRRYSRFLKYKMDSGGAAKGVSNRRYCRVKNSSNVQKSNNKPLNIGMIFAISSIWKYFVPLIFCGFCRDIM